MRPETFERSAAWLSELFADEPTRDPWAAMYGLAGLGLCSAAAPVLKNAAAHCCVLLEDEDLTPYDPVLVRLTHCTLTRLGFPASRPLAAPPPIPAWPSSPRFSSGHVRNKIGSTNVSSERTISVHGRSFAAMYATRFGISSPTAR